MKIWTDDECIEVEPDDMGHLEAAMLFKAEHIKAKADPELFAAVADMLSSLWDSATKRVDVVRCGQCKFDNLCCRNVGKDGKRTKDDFCSYGERKEGAD